MPRRGKDEGTLYTTGAERSDALRRVGLIVQLIQAVLDVLAHAVGSGRRG